MTRPLASTALLCMALVMASSSAMAVEPTSASTPEPAAPTQSASPAESMPPPDPAQLEAVSPSLPVTPDATPTVAAPTPAVGSTVPGFAGSFQLFLGLFIVLGLLAGVTFLLKKFGPARSMHNTAVKIVGGISVGNRERIIVVEVADQWIVVGVAPGRVNTLSTMQKQDSVDLPPTALPEKNFATWLKQTIDKRNGK